MFKRKCKHMWETVAENYVTPVSSGLELGGLKMTGPGAQDVVLRQLEVIERITLGVTSVAQRCIKCGIGRGYVVLGDARKAQPAA